MATKKLDLFDKLNVERGFFSQEDRVNDSARNHTGKNSRYKRRQRSKTSISK